MTGGWEDWIVRSSIICTFHHDQLTGEEMGGKCSTNGRNEKCIQILILKPEGKIALGRPGHEWENSIRMDLKEIGWQVLY
jgi:hypothetical protein